MKKVFQVTLKSESSINEEELFKCCKPAQVIASQTEFLKRKS